MSIPICSWAPSCKSQTHPSTCACPTKPPTTLDYPHTESMLMTGLQHSHPCLMIICLPLVAIHMQGQHRITLQTGGAHLVDLTTIKWALATPQPSSKSPDHQPTAATSAAAMGTDPSAPNPSLHGDSHHPSHLTGDHHDAALDDPIWSAYDLSCPQELVGRRVDVFWPCDKAFYTGLVTDYYASNKIGMVSALTKCVWTCNCN